MMPYCVEKDCCYIYIYVIYILYSRIHFLLLLLSFYYTTSLPKKKKMYYNISPELLDSSDPSLRDSTTTTPAPTDSSTLPDIMSTTTTEAPVDVAGEPFSQSGGTQKQHPFDQANDSRQFEPNLPDSPDYWNDVLMDSCDSMDCQTDTTDWSTTELDTLNQSNSDKHKIDLFLVPGVAFDKSGNRLGYGKGYYDQLLHNTTGLKIGICFDCQVVDAIPNETHDIKMDIIVTESRIIQ